MVLITLALPYLNHFVEKELVFNPFVQTDILAGLILLMLVVSSIAGLYPALFLSKINLVQALKGEQSMNKMQDVSRLPPCRREVSALPTTAAGSALLVNMVAFRWP